MVYGKIAHHTAIFVRIRSPGLKRELPRCGLLGCEGFIGGRVVASTQVLSTFICRPAHKFLPRNVNGLPIVRNTIESWLQTRPIRLHSSHNTSHQVGTLCERIEIQIERSPALQRGATAVTCRSQPQTRLSLDRPCPQFGSTLKICKTFSNLSRVRVPACFQLKG